MIKKIATLFGTLMFLASGTALAQTAPDALVKSTMNEVMSAIKTSKDKRALQEVAEKTVVQHFDFQAMTRLAVGKYWREASPAQQKSLENAFRSLLVNTYATALTQATPADQSVEVRATPMKPADDDVTVKTLVKESGRKPIAIDYRMAKADGGWKVYDVVVENLSLVTNYRGTFNTEIGKAGIDGLIKSLEAKNKHNAEG